MCLNLLVMELDEADRRLPARCNRSPPSELEELLGAGSAGALIFRWAANASLGRDSMGLGSARSEAWRTMDEEPAHLLRRFSRLPQLVARSSVVAPQPPPLPLSAELLEAFRPKSLLMARPTGERLLGFACCLSSLSSF